MANIESLLEQVQQAASTADSSLRFRLSNQLQRLARSIATPRQTMQSFGYAYTEQVAAKIAGDLDLFSILAQSNGPSNINEIAEKTGGDPTLIGKKDLSSRC
jgi:hypothetical protein